MSKNLYNDLKRKQEKELNNFPMFFAFSNKQFDEGMKKLDLQPTDTDKIYSFGYGGYYRKSDAKKLNEMFEKHGNEMKQNIKADKTGEGFIYDMFSYELSNHEYCITYDLDETLEVLCLTMKDINNNKNLSYGLKKALAKY